MTNPEEIIILDPKLADFAGDPAWKHIAWANAAEHATAQARQEQERRDRYTSRYLDSLPPKYRNYTLDSLRIHPGNRAAFDAAQALQPNQNLFLHGPAGTGKTHLAVATGRRFTESGLLVRCHGVVELIHQTRQSFGGTGVAPDLQTPQVLILDDFGKLKPTEWAYELLYAALEYRWAHELSTIITANHKPSTAAERASPDGESAGALLSRLASGITAQVTGTDERMGEVTQ